MTNLFDDSQRTKYLNYLCKHVSGVEKSYNWIVEYCPEIIDSLDNEDKKNLKKNILQHDNSKYSDREFNAYMDYFYNNGEINTQILNNFDIAWNYHQKENPHHWQYWVLINDSDDDKIKPLDIPMIYVIEMICDWWSFSHTKNDLYEIFSWYDKHKNKILVNDVTRYNIEMILDIIYNKLISITQKVIE